MCEVTEQSCRICVGKCSEASKSSKEVSERYNLCTGFQIGPDDIPKKVCTECINTLGMLWNFQNTCKATELKLKEFCTKGISKEEPVEASEPKEKLAEETIKNPVKPVCDKCGLTFKDIYYFRQHYNKHQIAPADAKMYCDICMQRTNQKFGFLTKERLAQHMQNHHLREKPKRPCPHCGQLFNNVHTLQSHTFRKHVDPKDYKFGCEVCERRFFKRELYENHKRSHTGEKICACDTCGAKFSTYNHLRKHIKHIHNPTVNTCEHCGKTFSSEAYLRQHLKTHNTGNYVCPLCPGKAFSLTTTLRSHIKTNHPEFPLPPPGTKLKGFNWNKALQEIEQS